MQFAISLVEADGGQTATSLYRWLSRDSRVTACAEVSLQSGGARPGEMGSVEDLITAVFADAGAMAGVGSLLVAYRAWRDTRTRPPAITIEKDGVTVEVNEGSEQQIRQVLSAFFPGADIGGDPNPTAVAGTPGEDPAER